MDNYQRAVQKKYKQLLDDVATSVFYKTDLTNRINCYICPSGHVTKTKDVAAGVTPMMHKCSKCDTWGRSSFYEDIAPDVEPTEEWYRPDLEETLKLRDNPGLLDHVLSGGLLCRKIQTDKNG